MKVNDVSKSLGIQNKELIDFYNSKGYKVSSHMQNVSDEMIQLAYDNFETDEVEEPVKKTETVEKKKTAVPEVNLKTFSPDDMIPCKSVVPYKLITLGVDGKTIYSWEYYGDVDYLKYSDLQALRKKAIVTDPMILIMDEDLCYQWRRELNDTYKYYLGVDYPEDFFAIDNDKFEDLLKKAPDTLKNVIKITALSMIRNENYPDVKKVKLIDEILGTCISEFLV